MAQAKLKGQPKNTAKYRMMSCACNAARAGQGMWHQFWKLFAAVKPPIVTFLPHGGGTAHSQNVPCRPHATGTNQQRNKQGTHAKKRPLQRQGTNAEQANHEVANTTTHQQDYCSGHDVTINKRHASRPTPNCPGMHCSKQERRPTGWRPPTTIPTNTTEHHITTITNPTSQR